MAHRLLLILAVAAASLLVGSPVSAARPCHTFLFSLSAHPNPSNDPYHRAPLTSTVITVFRVRRLGPHTTYHGRGHGHIHALPNRHHLHSIPANIQIRRPELPELPHPAAAAAGIQERAKDVLVVVVGFLFGVGCGALTAASMYLVWSVLAGAAASSNYDELYGDEDDDEASDSESPKKVGYVIIPGVEAHDGGKN